MKRVLVRGQLLLRRKAIVSWEEPSAGWAVGDNEHMLADEDAGEGQLENMQLGSTTDLVLGFHLTHSVAGIVTFGPLFVNFNDRFFYVSPEPTSRLG